ncbi:MAG: Co2+/Mg2+ efflux protein ApaG [Flavobacteriales bacterium]
MKTAVSQNIEISVSPRFEEKKSSSVNNSFIHSYKVVLKNNNIFPVKLLERCWFIFDSTEGSYTVFGEGVIGQKPVIQPSETYTYSSYCEMSNEMGRMKGFYNLRNELTGEILKATIPTFNLELPFALN